VKDNFGPELGVVNLGDECKGKDTEMKIQTEMTQLVTEHLFYIIISIVVDANANEEPQIRRYGVATKHSRGWPAPLTRY
jgi:hypothetical protein